MTQFDHEVGPAAEGAVRRAEKAWGERMRHLLCALTLRSFNHRVEQPPVSSHSPVSPGSLGSGGKPLPGAAGCIMLGQMETRGRALSANCWKRDRCSCALLAAPCCCRLLLLAAVSAGSEGGASAGGGEGGALSAEAISMSMAHFAGECWVVM